MRQNWVKMMVLSFHTALFSLSVIQIKLLVKFIRLLSVVDHGNEKWHADLVLDIW